MPQTPTIPDAALDAFDPPRFAKGYGFDEEPSCLLLVNGLAQAIERAKQIRDILRAEGLTTTDNKGNLKAHPLLAAEAACQSSIIRHLRALRIDTLPNYSKPGRPPGT